MTNAIPPRDADHSHPTAKVKPRGSGHEPASSATRRQSARATTAPASPRGPRRVVLLPHGYLGEAPSSWEIGIHKLTGQQGAQSATELIFIAATNGGLGLANEMRTILSDDSMHSEPAVGSPSTQTIIIGPVHYQIRVIGLDVGRARQIAQGYITDQTFSADHLIKLNYLIAAVLSGRRKASSHEPTPEL